MRFTTGLIITVCGCALLLDRSSAIDPLTAIEQRTGKGISDFLPGASEVLSFGKDLLFGSPLKVILGLMNKFCSVALGSEDGVERIPEVIPELGNVSLAFLDMKYNRSFDVSSIGDMVNLDTFNKTYSTVILTTGWLSMDDNKTNGAAEWILDAYNCRGDVNFIVRGSSIGR